MSEKEIGFISHLTELRRRLISSLIFLAVLFIICYIFSDHIYGSVFYMATGFHGFHVLVGTIFLAVCLFRGKRGHFTKDHHFGFEAAAWYWHFVDVVWLFLFAAIYIWGS